MGSLKKQVHRKYYFIIFYNVHFKFCRKWTQTLNMEAKTKSSLDKGYTKTISWERDKGQGQAPPTTHTHTQKKPSSLQEESAERKGRYTKREISAVKSKFV